MILEAARYYQGPGPHAGRGRPGIFLFLGLKNMVLPSSFGLVLLLLGGACGYLKAEMEARAHPPRPEKKGVLNSGWDTGGRARQNKEPRAHEGGRGHFWIGGSGEHHSTSQRAGKGLSVRYRAITRGKEVAEVIIKAVVIFVGVLIGELIGRWIDRRRK